MTSPLIPDYEDDSTEEDIVTIDDLGDGDEVDVIIKTHIDVPRVRFQNYEIQNSFFDIDEEDRQVFHTVNNVYAIEVDITLEYTQYLLEINKEEGMIIDTEDKVYSVIQQIELNRGKKYFSPNANASMQIAIALFVFKSNPLSIYPIFSDPNHPFTNAECSDGTIPFLRLLNKDTIPYIAHIDFSSHNISVRIEIMSDVCHYLSTLPNTEQRREQIAKHIFDYLREKDVEAFIRGNVTYIEYFILSKQKYGVCPFFLISMMDYVKTLPEQYRSIANRYIYTFRTYK